MRSERWGGAGSQKPLEVLNSLLPAGLTDLISAPSSALHLISFSVTMEPEFWRQSTNINPYWCSLYLHFLQMKWQEGVDHTALSNRNILGNSERKVSSTAKPLETSLQNEDKVYGNCVVNHG